MGKNRKTSIQYTIHRWSTRMSTKEMEMDIEVKVVGVIKVEVKEEEDHSVEDMVEVITTTSTVGRMTT
jgi:glutamate racemase